MREESRLAKAMVRDEFQARLAATEKRVERPDDAELARRYSEGESLKILGKECGLTEEGVRCRIKRWTLAARGDAGHADIVTEALVARVADADEKLEKAKDSVQVSKYREMARFARMDLERRRPALYGPKQEVKHSGGSSNFTVVLLDRPTGGAKEIDVTPVPALSAPEVAGSEKQGESE